MACLPRKLFEIQNLDAAVSFSERMHIIDITEDFTGTDGEVVRRKPLQKLPCLKSPMNVRHAGFGSVHVRGVISGAH